MDDHDREQILKITPVLMITAPKLMTKLLVTYLRFRGQAHRASRELKKGLVSEGMPHDIADSLTKEYENETKIFSLMSQFTPR